MYNAHRGIPPPAPLERLRELTQQVEVLFEEQTRDAGERGCKSTPILLCSG
jgi:hypothetical protein